jgi:hypothetical protein
MKRAAKIILGGLVLLLAAFGFGQEKTKAIRHEHRPAAPAETVSNTNPPQPNYNYSSILDGTPMLLELHHDTEVGSGKPIDVYLFAIELQVLNSDGNFEPEGLILDNFYTAKPVSPETAPNPHNARDCKIWNSLVLNEIKNRNDQSPTWSYVEFTVALGARVIQTNEDGQVWWSDDVECWGSRDRFPPF